MLHGSLDNYIEMLRQRHGLSQSELAVLIGVEQRASVSQFERGIRQPNLETLLALQIVLGANAEDIFAGVAHDVRDRVTSKARALLESIDDTPSPENIAKYELLSRLVRPDDISIIPSWREE